MSLKPLRVIVKSASPEGFKISHMSILHSKPATSDAAMVSPSRILVQPVVVPDSLAAMVPKT